MYIYYIITIMKENPNCVGVGTGGRGSVPSPFFAKLYKNVIEDLFLFAKINDKLAPQLSICFRRH